MTASRSGEGLRRLWRWRRPAQRSRRLLIGAVLLGLCFCVGCRGRQTAPLDCPERNSLDSTSRFTTCWSVGGEYTSVSSPRAADLNNDGVLDLVVGHGYETEFPTPLDTVGYVTAHDGRTGEQLWRVEARQELVGSAAFGDLNGDGAPDVVIGGRHAELMAIEGETGSVLWRFYEDGGAIGARADGWYNFYSPQVVPDQDADGVPDLLVTNGGDSLLSPDAARPPGHVMILSGRDGSILAALETPDGAETYMSPVVFSDGGRPLEVIFGTGGETFPGALYRMPLSGVLANDAASARVLATGATKGFIAPVALADLTADGRFEIVAASFEGTLLAIDDQQATTIEHVVPMAESFTAPTLAFVDDDDVPDIFGSFNLGVWPDYTGARHILVDGATGEIRLDVTVGAFSGSGSVAGDIDADGRDEIRPAVNMTDPADPTSLVLQLFLLEEPTRALVPFGAPFEHASMSTPYLGDLDADGVLDLVITTGDLLESSTWEMHRIVLDAEAPASISWGSYLGTDYDAVLRARP